MVFFIMGIHPYMSGGLIIPMNNIQIIKDPFGIPIWATIFTFQIYLHTFYTLFYLYVFLKITKKLQKFHLKLLYQTPPKSSNLLRMGCKTPILHI